MKKIVWYLNHYSSPLARGQGFRGHYLASELIRNQVKLYIMPASFHHLLRVPCDQHSIFRHEVVDGVDYFWLKAKKYYNNSFLRLLNMLSYTWSLFKSSKEIIKITGTPDAIVVSSAHPFHFPVAFFLAKKYKTKIFFEVRDLWPMSLIQILKVPFYHPLVLIISVLEKMAYKFSDYTISLLPHAFSYMKMRGLTIKKFAYIPNGIDAHEFYSSEPLLQDLEEAIVNLKKAGYFIVGYAGAHGAPNALMQLMQAAKILLMSPEKICFIQVGEGNEKEILQEYAKNNKLTNVLFFDPISKKQIQSFLKLIDLAFIGFLSLPIYEYGISCNKIFDYMLAKKPILIASDIKMDSFPGAGCFIKVNANKPDLLAKKILSLAQCDRGELRAMGMAGYQYLINNHDYSILAKKFLSLLGKGTNEKII